ncbi:DUF378 domain-containing protein [Peribacillus sp. SCS-37]|uniref:DUF378 domain-containing protein n=1 Tax=Paraperibacillus esterisolvens TaxID=3115296 RepID=UPI003905E974
MKFLSFITWLLLAAGGLNWAFEAAGYNFVEGLLGSAPSAVSTVYWLVGFSALYQIFLKLKGK